MITKGTGYVKGSGAKSRLKAHMKYIEHRERGPEEQEDRAIFGKDLDDISRAEAMNDIMDHAKASVAYHKIVLSPDRTQEQVYDWKEWTRETMNDLQERKGLELHWYAVHHANTDDEHVHVVLAGGGENENGDLRQVRMEVDDYKFLNERGHERSEHEFHRDMQEHMREAEREEDFHAELYRMPERERESEREPERQPEHQPGRREREREPERQPAPERTHKEREPERQPAPAPEPIKERERKPERQPERDDWDRGR